MSETVLTVARRARLATQGLTYNAVSVSVVYRLSRGCFGDEAKFHATLSYIAGSLDNC